MKMLDSLLQAIERLELDNKKILLIGLISILVIYVDYSYIIKLQFRSLRNTNSKIVRLEKDIGNISKDLTKMQQFKTKPADASQWSAAKNKIIISKEQVAPLLEDISAIANKNNIKIMQIKPLKESKGKDVTTGSVLISLDLVGNYHNLWAFVNEIENALELMAVEGMKMEPDSMNYLQQKVNLILRAYLES